MPKKYKVLTYHSDNEALRNLEGVKKKYYKYDVKKIKNFILIFHKEKENEKI